MTHASLFTGFGMFDYAAEMAGLENIFQVEIDEFCQKLLSVRFPGTDKYRDIKEFIKEAHKYEGRINIISGGFPCQPHSIAGQRKGSEDERNLFPEMLEVIRIIKPEWIWARMFTESLIQTMESFSNTKLLHLWKMKVTRFNRILFQLQPSGRYTGETGLWIIAYRNEIRFSGERFEGQRIFGADQARNENWECNQSSKNSRHRNDKRQENKKNLQMRLELGKPLNLNDQWMR